MATREARPGRDRSGRSDRRGRAARRRSRPTTPARRRDGTRTGDGTTGARCQARPVGARSGRRLSGVGGIHSRRGETRSLPRPRRRTGAPPTDGQGRVAPARAPAPSGSHRRRSRGVTGRHAEDGRDQRGLRGDLSRRRRGSARRAAERRRCAPSTRARRGRGAAGRPARSRRGRSRGGSTLSGTVRPRNAPIRPHGADGESARATVLTGQPPLRFATHHREPPRASDPTGPLERARIRDFRRPPPPALEDAVVRELEFGKFRGHTLGEVAAFEPSYIDWLAKTITRDPELVAAARVLQTDLDDRGIPRREHATARDIPGAQTGPLRLSGLTAVAPRANAPDVAVAPRRPGRRPMRAK